MIYFLRHCEKEKGYFYDENKKILDDPLSAEGILHSQRIAERFGDIEISRIIASGHKRAYQTALPAARAKGLSRRDRRARE